MGSSIYEITIKMENEKILVLIPAYNEESSIEEVMQGIRNVMGNVDILVINDGSSDKTESIVKNFGVKIITLPFNLGYGAALQTGYIYAKRNDYDIVIQIDGDNQHDATYIKDFIETLRKEKVDVVIGSRYLQKNGYKTQWTRKIGMAIFRFIATAILGQKITDPTSGFQALRKDVVHFFTNDLYPPDYPDTDMLILLHLAGFRLKEIPVKMYNLDLKKTMHRGHKIIYYVFKMFLSIVVTLVRKNPSKRIEV